MTVDVQSSFAEIRRLGRLVDEGCKAIPPALAWTEGRDGYVAWRGAWRAEMRAIVAGIVLAKTKRRTSGDLERSSAQSDRERLRHEAFAMLVLRRASKRKAAAEQSARRAVVIAA